MQEKIQHICEDIRLAYDLINGKNEINRKTADLLQTLFDHMQQQLDDIHNFLHKPVDEPPPDYSDPYNPAEEIARINGDIPVWDEETHTYYI